MKVYIVYSCYSESYENPSIFFEACATEAKAKEIFQGYIDNVKEQSMNSYEERYDEDEKSYEDAYSIDEGDRTFECIERNGDQSWEVYILEQDLLV